MSRGRRAWRDAVRLALVAVALPITGTFLGAFPAHAEVLTLTPDEALMTARAAYLSGQTEVAAHIARVLAEVDPGNALVHLLLSASEVKLGRPDTGYQAGKTAWRLTPAGPATRPLRYEIARNTAKAALETGRPMLAQYWLRRSLDVAPDAAAKLASGRDIGALRDRTPLRFAIDLQSGPSNNLNGGAEDPVFRIGNYVVGTLSNGAEALSGSRASLRLNGEYALAHQDRGLTVLTLSTEATRNHIDARSRPKAGSMTSRDLDSSRLAIGLRREMRLGEIGWPVSLSVEVGQNWSGGAVFGPSLGFAAQTALWRGEAGTLWFGGSAERIWDGTRPSGGDHLSLSLAGEQRLGGAKGTAALTIETARTGHPNSSFDAANLSIQLQPQWQIAGAAITLGANAGMRDYDEFSLIGGAVSVSGGRQDRSIGVTMDLSFDDFGVMGFAPVLSLRHGITHSNVSRYETKTSGISIGISSLF